jgi:hypothetical protein
MEVLCGDSFHLEHFGQFIRTFEGCIRVGKSIGANVPKAWKFFAVTHSTWSTLDNSLGRLRGVYELATLIIDVELRRGNLAKGGELRTCLSLEDCADKQIAT